MLIVKIVSTAAESIFEGEGEARKEHESRQRPWVRNKHRGTGAHINRFGG
jgi:hypothetical protein